MPVSKKNPKVPDDNLPNRVVWYNVVDNPIAVNLYQMKYVPLNKREQDHCSSPLHHYCDVWSLVFSITLHKLCICIIMHIMSLMVFHLCLPRNF